MKVEKITLNIKYVFGCFATIALVGAAYANLTNADVVLTSNIEMLRSEDVKIYKRIDGGTVEVKEIDDDVAQCLRDVAVIKSTLQNQEHNNKEQTVLLREILKLQLLNEK